MNFLNNMRIGTRLNTVLSIVIIVIISALSIYIVGKQKHKIIADTDLRMFEQVEELNEIINLQIEKNQELVNTSIKAAEYYLKTLGAIEISEETTIFNAINQDSKSTSRVEVPVWKINGNTIHNSNAIVDQIQREIGGTATIFQKIPQGYLRISTNVLNTNGSRATGTFIPNNSEVAQTINRGNSYYGRAFVVDDFYLTAYQPLKINGNVEGILYVGVKEKDLSGLANLFNSKKYYENGYPFFVDKEGTFIIHPTKPGENFYNAEFFQQLINSGKNKGKTFYLWEGDLKYQYFVYNERTESYISASIYEKDLMGIINQIVIAVIIASLIGIAIFILITSFISKNISTSLNRAVKLSQSIASGNLTDMLEIDQKDEVGDLANALNSMVAKLKDMVSQIINGANSIASASQELSGTSIQLSQGATEQASSVEEVSSTMEEIASNIEQNNQNAQQTETNSSNALKNIESVSSQSQDALIAQKNIAEKIQIINDIAFQTNILALNAAVEAARAGESGKGFAVVAAEVRKLAERSKVAADEIVSLAENGYTLAESAGKGMEEALPNVKKTTSLVQEIAAASVEQTNGVNQVNNAVQQLNDITQQNAAASEEMASNAEELSAQAQQLKEFISYFNIGESKQLGKSFSQTTPKTKSKPQVTKKEASKEMPKSSGVQKQGNGNKSGINLNMFTESASDSDFESF